MMAFSLLFIVLEIKLNQKLKKYLTIRTMTLTQKYFPSLLISKLRLLLKFLVMHLKNLSLLIMFYFANWINLGVILTPSYFWERKNEITSFIRKSTLSTFLLCHSPTYPFLLSFSMNYFFLKLQLLEIMTQSPIYHPVMTF